MSKTEKEMTPKRAIVWFRQDLRLHDNEALSDALSQVDEIIPVYVFDERVFKGQTRFGQPKTGAHRARFVIESVQDLRDSLRSIGSELHVRVGKPEEVIFELALATKTNWVFCNRERTSEEAEVQDSLEQKLWSIGQEMRYYRGKMLFYTADLPFPVPHTPDVFSHFRKEVERYVKVRQPMPSPKPRLNAPSVRLEPGEMPTLADFGHDEACINSRAALEFRGGETAALARLKYYLWDTHLIKTYKETRNELLGGDYSSKFSPWLAQGCLSPKLVYHEVKRYEAAHGSNESTYWLIFELLWRDFFRFMGKKHGNKIFQKGGTRGEINPRWRSDYKLLQRWIDGETGVPFIDANMRELKQTGFMSNRGRQNVASYLVKDLNVNWQMGADYFESVLLDYDVCSNWGNWNYVAGVGSDPREDRYFNILTQARRYDAEGDYVRHWLPELAHLPAEHIHTPDQLSQAEQSKLSIRIGADYPKAITSTVKWSRQGARR